MRSEHVTRHKMLPSMACVQAPYPRRLAHDRRVVPHSSIDTEAGWTYSGWHGWVYGCRLHLACTVAGVWIPLAARLTPANVHDGRIAPLLIEALPKEALFVLGDKHYDAGGEAGPTEKPHSRQRTRLDLHYNSEGAWMPGKISAV